MINDTPKFLTNELTLQTHAIVINIEDSDAENDNLILPLEATRCTIISLHIRLNGMVARADLTRYLTVRMKRSISGTCSFLDA